MVIDFVGLDKRRAARYGRATVDSVEQFVLTRYRQGWSALTVIRDGEQAGGIRIDRNRRVWWAEADPDSAHVR